MKTIEKLCQYKDLADLVYRYVYALLMKEVIVELYELSKTLYNLSNTDYSYPLLYNDAWIGIDEDENNIPCFNWRTPPAPYDDIFHISHKTKSFAVIEMDVVVTPRHYT